MLEKTKIINSALRRIGSGGLNLPDISGPAGALATAAYDGALRHCLSLYPWAFATVYSRMAELSTAPLFGYAHAYQIPGGCVRVIDVHMTDLASSDDITPDYILPVAMHAGETGPLPFGTVRYERAGDALYCDVTPAWLRHVSEDFTGTASPLFVDALTWRLAFELCPLVAQGGSKASDVYQLYTQAMAQAKETECAETRRKDTDPSLSSVMLAERFS